MAASADTKSDNDTLKKILVFLVGFIAVLPLRLALACAKYAIGRFHLPVSKLGVFIKLFHNPIELGGLAGFAVSNTIAAVVKEKKAKAALSVITNCFVYFLSLLTLYVYTSGGDLGDPNLYLWTIVGHYFMVGINVTFSIGLESDAVNYANAGIPVSSVFVSLYHKVFLYFADKYLLQDVDYWLVFGQIVANSVLMYITATCWTMYCTFNHFTGSGSTNSENETSLTDALKEARTWSPAMIVVFALGALYCVYPGITPFLLVDPNTAYNIELINLIVQTIPALVICILDECKIGPGDKWDNNKAWWNLSWVIEAYALFCVYTCYTILHYPESFLGKLIIGNSALVGFLTVSFVTAQEGLKALGLTAVGVQKGGKGSPCGQLPTITLAVSLAILNFTNFLGDGYLQTYRKADKQNWPTEGYTRYRGFKFWLSSAFKLAKKNLLNAFNVDVRSRTLM